MIRSKILKTAGLGIFLAAVLLSNLADAQTPYYWRLNDRPQPPLQNLEQAGPFEQQVTPAEPSGESRVETQSNGLTPAANGGFRSGSVKARGEAAHNRMPAARRRSAAKKGTEKLSPVGSVTSVEIDELNQCLQKNKKLAAEIEKLTAQMKQLLNDIKNLNDDVANLKKLAKISKTNKPVTFACASSEVSVSRDEEGAIVDVIHCATRTPYKDCNWATGKCNTFCNNTAAWCSPGYFCDPSPAPGKCILP